MLALIAVPQPAGRRPARSPCPFPGAGCILALGASRTVVSPRSTLWNCTCKWLSFVPFSFDWMASTVLASIESPDAHPALGLLPTRTVHVYDYACLPRTRVGRKAPRYMIPRYMVEKIHVYNVYKIKKDLAADLRVILGSARCGRHGKGFLLLQSFP